MNLPKLRTLADYTKPELIIPQLATRTTTSVMQELTTALHREDGSVPDQSSSSTAALIRELLTSMALDFGAAFPQVRVASLSRSRFALGRSSHPLPWRASGFPPTELVFLILEPSKTDPEFDQLVTTLHGLGKDRARLDGLRSATSAEEMLAVLAQIPLVAISELVAGDSPRILFNSRFSHYWNSSALSRSGRREARHESSARVANCLLTTPTPSLPTSARHQRRPIKSGRLA